MYKKTKFIITVTVTVTITITITIIILTIRITTIIIIIIMFMIKTIKMLFAQLNLNNKTDPAALISLKTPIFPAHKSTKRHEPQTCSL